MVYYYQDCAFNTPPGVYEPKEDSALLADNQMVEKGDYVLDMGCGSGIQAIVASRKAKKVLAVDINPQAIETARRNAETNNSENIDYRISDLFGNIKEDEKFDMIIFNPPYVPSDEKDMEAKAWAGGTLGRETIDRFLEAAPNHLTEKGRIQFLVSSVNDPQDIIKKLEKKKLGTNIIASQKLWFEELFVLLVKRI
jgi:release factor glutamine methyltransferase